MTILFLDSDFLISIFGETQGDPERLTRILDGLLQKYDVRITDNVP
jgi:hypothetical protein